MKKKLISLSLLMVLSSCAPSSFNPPFISSSNTHSSQTPASTSLDSIQPKDYGAFLITTSNGTYTEQNGVYTITTAGTYNLTGTLSEGYIYINATEDDAVTLNLNNVCISSTTNSPIYALSADEVKLYSNTEYENTIIDNRATKVEDVETQGNGAIYSKCDLKLTGNGKLNVKASYNNGVHSTKDLKIKNNVLTVNSVNNCLKGNDSIEIESGKLLLISSSGNGLITEDSDISSKGNQRGNIDISGGSIDIYSCKDAIDASYNANVSGSSTKINVYTSNYSTYSGEVATSSSTTKYIKLSSRVATNRRLSVYYKYNTDKFDFVDTTYFTSQSERSGGGRPGGSGTTYYFYKFELPTSASSIQLYLFESTSSNSTTNYVAKSDTYNINSNYDTAYFTFSNNTYSLSKWTTYTTSQQGGPGGGGMGPGQEEGNTDKASYSAKGIKAANTINISGGEIYIKAYDDGIHCNYGETLGNGETGLGDVNISGGNISIYASDDGIRADRYLNISGGSINIISSYEGLEANILQISGGDTLVYATDDGLNATNKSGLSPAIIVSGGKTDISVASGDTDGIDSNGSFTQSGGIVISRGSGGGMSTGLDVDGTASISEGTLLFFGKPEKTPSKTSNVSYQTISGTFSAKTYTFTCGETSFSTTNKLSFSGVYIYSSLGNTWTYR